MSSSRCIWFLLPLAIAACAAPSDRDDDTSNPAVDDDGSSSSSDGGGGGSTTSTSGGNGPSSGGSGPSTGGSGPSTGGSGGMGGGMGGAGGAGGSLATCDESLSTGEATVGGWDGMMFDLTATSDITIYEMEVNLIFGTHDVEIYAAQNPFSTDETNAGAWTLVASVQGVVSTGPSTPITITLDTPVSIPATAQRGMYVTTVGTDGFGVEYAAGTSIGYQGGTDANLIIHDGVGTNYPFGGAIGSSAPRRFTGAVVYETACP